MSVKEEEQAPVRMTTHLSVKAYLQRLTGSDHAKTIAQRIFTVHFSETPTETIIVRV